jgi:O-antigen ligase
VVVSLRYGFPRASFLLAVITMLLCYLSMLLVVFYPELSIKTLHVSGGVALLAILSHPKMYIKNKVWYLALPLLCLGVIDLSWYECFKFNGSENIASYRGHLEFGKNAVFSSVALIVITKSEITSFFKKKYYFILAFLSQLMALGYAVYQHYYLGINRIALSLAHGANATGAAYTITFLTLCSAICILYSEVKHKNIFFLAAVAIGFYTVSLTGTRAALVTLPALCLAMFILHAREWGSFGVKKGIVAIFVIAACFFAAKDTFIKRYDSLVDDITKYQNENSRSSVGARLAMLEAGYIVSNEQFLWQSTEQRNNKINDLASNNKIYVGALVHMHAHLHNDFIETLSLKGWAGVFVWLLFFSGAIKLILLVHEKYALLVYFLGVFIYGLSDVMFFSKNISLGWMVPLMLILSYLSKRRVDKNIISSRT